MKSKVQKTRRSRAIQPFEPGQIWQMEGSQIEIGLTGKRLVHYRHYKPMAKRPSVQLSGKEALEKFLRSHGAILLDRAAARPAESSRSAR
jgi:hypothetical protein